MNPYYNPYPPSPNPVPGGSPRTSMATEVPQIDMAERNSWKENSADYAQGALGLLSLGADWATIANQGLGLEGRTQPSTNAYSGDYFNMAQNAQVQGLSGGELLGGIGKGAMTGFKFGGPLGAGIGAAAGGFGTIFASNRRRRRQEDERNEALSDALSYQQDYNQAQNTRNQQEVSAADYRRRLDSYHQNLYQWSAI